MLFEAVSWSWLLPLVLVCFVYLTMKALVSELKIELGKEASEKFAGRWLACRVTLAIVIFISLFMFRFATSI